MAEHDSNEVQPVAQTLKMRMSVPVEPAPQPAAPVTFDLGKSVGDLHGGQEPVTWAGGSLELVEVAEHRPTSALDRDPSASKRLNWAIGGAVGLVLILGFAFGRGDEAEAGDPPDSQAAVEIPAAPEEPAPAPVPVPEPEPAPKKVKGKKAAAKADSTLAAGSEKAASPSPSKPVSKPAASKPAATTPSKPAATTPAAPTPSKPAGPNLAPPEEDAGSSKAALPDVEGWDDKDAALGDRSAEGV